MTQRIPQSIPVLMKRLRQVARWLDQKAEQPLTWQGKAQLKARANVCWQVADLLEDARSILETIHAEHLAEDAKRESANLEVPDDK